MPLTLFPVLRIPHTTKAEGQVIQYEVQGLPPKTEILIGLFQGRWKIRRTIRGLSDPWVGDFETAEAALASLEPEAS